MTARQKTLALLTVVIALVLEIVDFTIVNTALPSIRRDFGGGGDVTQYAGSPGRTMKRARPPTVPVL